MRKRSRILGLTAVLAALGILLGTTPALAAPPVGNFYCGLPGNLYSVGAASPYITHNPGWNYTGTWCASYSQLHASNGAYYSTPLVGTFAFFTLKTVIHVDSPVYFERFEYGNSQTTVCTATPTFGSVGLSIGDTIYMHSTQYGVLDVADVVYTDGSQYRVPMGSLCQTRPMGWLYGSQVYPIQLNPYVRWVFNDIHSDGWTNTHYMRN
jgi:hypothetical protein